MRSRKLAVCLLFGLGCQLAARAEVILQYFNTSWNEIAYRMPELAEAGYTALWLPPPFKAGNQYSVGFDTFDRFDFGSKNQMGGIPTRYGTAGDLLTLVETAHRFGIRVYFDNVMAHNGGPIPGYDENTSVNAQPGFVPEDFHLIRRLDGTYHKPPDDLNYGDEWQCLYRNPFGIDIAQENPNSSFGLHEGDTFPKYNGIRQPNNPEYYPDLDLTVATNGFGQAVHPFANKEPFQDVGYGASHIGAGNGKFDWDDLNGNGQHDPGEPSEPFDDTGVDPSNPAHQTAAWGYGNGRYDMGNPIAEDVNAMLMRAVRWFEDQSRCDGFRLDAVKHVPSYFFGQQSGADKDKSNWGYGGAIQEQFNITHGYSDWDNHRDSLFNDSQGRDDAMLFGEHLGQPDNCTITCYGQYIDAGMRLSTDDFMNKVKDNIGGNLTGMDQPGYGLNLSVSTEVDYLMSHDHNNLYDGDRADAHVYMLTVTGLPIVYTDGYNQSVPPDWFPTPAYTPFLGQFGQSWMLNALYLNQLFGRGDQVAKWSDQNFVAYERRDKRENPGMSDADGTVMLFMMARNYNSGQSRALQTTFPAGARLRNYSVSGGAFYVTVNTDGTVVNDQQQLPIVPSGGWFAFSWTVPELTLALDGSQVAPITILQNGQPVGTMSYQRKDGVNGDPNYGGTVTIPRITSGTNLSFIARADGSTANILMKLDGGIDLNSQMGLGSQSDPAKRDNPPALSTDVFLGYEQTAFAQRIAEKFAASDISRNVIGSPGAETYQATIGTAGFTVNNGGGPSAGGITWVYHDPVVNNQKPSPTLQFFPAPENAASQPVTVWVKVGYAGQPQKAFLYYTTDGATYPEGSGGVGKGTTQVVEMNYDSPGTADGTGTPDWWKATLPALPGATVLRYKIGVYRTDASPVFPFADSDIALKKRMEAVYNITNFNGTTVSYFPNNDYGAMAVGLSEGFHILRTKAFLQRDSRSSIYNLDTQTFYYDTKTPEGVILFPGENDTLTGSRYGVVVRTDRTASEAWYRITDSNPQNDDSNTGVGNGNGTWVKALQVTPTLTSSYPLEWRFDYVNIASSGTATIEVRLRELSSSTNMNLTDVAGHYTTLTRTVNTAGLPQQMFIAFPQFDGQVIGAGYVMKCNFSKSLADGLTTDQLLDTFSMTIDGVARARSEFSIVYNETADHHALSFTFPNLYDGFPDHQHPIQVTFNRTGYPVLVANRTVLALPVSAPYINIITPPAVDANNLPYKIVLPDVANPTVSQRVYQVQVDTGTNVTSVALAFTQGSGSLTPNAGNPVTNGTFESWFYTWSFPLTNVPSLIEGNFRLQATVTGGSAIRDTTVVLRQIVAANPNDDDDDDDGILDTDETTPKALPTTPYTQWNNGDVHAYFAFGHTDPLSPDTDGDGLPDGLEIGLSGPAGTTGTDLNADTNGNGFKNFIADVDPPIYNTHDNQNVPVGYESYSPWRYNPNKLPTDLIAGTVTDPTKPDTDSDGLKDGVEDMNRNGRVDIGLTNQFGVVTNLIAHPATFYNTSIIDRATVLSFYPNAVWLETDPNNADTDGDGLNDGFENGDLDGFMRIGLLDRNIGYSSGSATVTGMLAKPYPSSILYWPGTSRVNYKALIQQFPNAVLLDADPLNPDTDGDGFPDGWEISHGLNPWDDGVPGHTNSNTGAIITTTDNGPDGDPDGDGCNNLCEYISGTDPHVVDHGVPPPPPGSIVIGPGTNVVVGGVTNSNELTDWTADDLIALDPYDALDGAYNGGDVYYRPWASDGYESSRDLVAFYAHDGGAVAQGGDGNFYFRVDLQNLQPGAQFGHLDLYVVIDTGNPAVGERKLPDNIETLTDMRWEAVVAVYDDNNGRVYVNTPGSVDSTGLADDLSQPQYGIQVRDKSSADGFKQASYNSDLDAVEFSISRKALLDAGWDGDPTRLNYQVFTTRDGTSGGAGELDGPDITDSIRTDWIAEDFAGINTGNDVDGQRYRGRIALTTLSQWVGIHADNDRGKRVKVISLVHGNQAIQPGNVMQDLVNNNAGAGYYRPLDAHEAFGVPLTMHITPTLASAIQWAKVDPAANKPWRDGPALNARIAGDVAAGKVDLLASTFSDHMLPYFDDAYNANNISLATDFLQTIYGGVSSKVLWTPERLADGDALTRIKNNLGFSYTFLDQMQHLRGWFGYDGAVGVNGYRLNEINGVKCFPINDQFSGQQFQNYDNGPSILLRQLLNRRARTGQWDNQHPQVLTLFSNWEDFTNKANADAYDKNIHWMASRPWIQLVTADQIANNTIDISVPPDGTGDVWNTVNRGSGLTLPKLSTDWITYSSQGNFDNWYNGSGLNQGLAPLVFDIRPGSPVPTTYGRQSTTGISKSAWDQVTGINNNSLAKLARAALHASTFETAFHTQSTSPVSLTRFTDGSYVTPDTTFDNVVFFSRAAQAQTRMAAIYKRVDTWAGAAQGGAYNSSVVATQEDIDLDDENEYLLYNDRLFAVFERIGGRMTAAWLRDGANVVQVLGNLASYAGSDTEFEIDSYRTSGFKDTGYANDLYTPANAPAGTGWQFTSGDGKIVKRITLAASASSFAANYTLTGLSQIAVRFGLSPNTYDLLLHGQQNLSGAVDDSQAVSVFNFSAQLPVRDFIRHTGATYNATATDGSYDTLRMLNEAQTRQIEITGATGMSFDLGVEDGPGMTSDIDGDGLPDGWEWANGLNYQDATGDNGADGDPDGDGMSNAQEFLAGTAPLDASSALRIVRVERMSDGSCEVTWTSVPGKKYEVQASTDMQTFGSISGTLMASSATTVYTDSGALEHRFYRIRLVP